MQEAVLNNNIKVSTMQDFSSLLTANHSIFSSEPSTKASKARKNANQDKVSSKSKSAKTSNKLRDHDHKKSRNKNKLRMDKCESTSSVEPIADSSESVTPVDKPANCVESKGKIFTCTICNKSFGYKHVLQNHERTHTGEKPFECPHCQKKFTRDHHLKTHMRLHTAEKPYHCDQCDRLFVQIGNLRRHLRVHTGEKPYPCELCPSRFSDSNQLKHHLMIHRGIKPFECTSCLRRFRRRHRLLHHKCAGTVESSHALLCKPILKDEEDDLPEASNKSAAKRKPRKNAKIKCKVEKVSLRSAKAKKSPSQPLEKTSFARANSIDLLLECVNEDESENSESSSENSCTSPAPICED